MKTNFFKAVIVLGAIILTSSIAYACAYEVIKEKREVGAFDGIQINGVFDVFITQGDKEVVLIEAHAEMLPDIVTKVRDSRLILNMKEGKEYKNYKKAKVFITVIDVNRIQHNGVGNLIFSDPITLKELKVANNGVGTLELRGTADVCTIINSGVGSVKAADFITKKLDLTNSGVGSVEVYATDELSIVNSGVGRVTYSGGAVITNLNSSGIGRIKKKKD